MYTFPLNPLKPQGKNAIMIEFPLFWALEIHQMSIKNELQRTKCERLFAFMEKETPSPEKNNGGMTRISWLPHNGFTHSGANLGDGHVAHVQHRGGGLAGQVSRWGNLDSADPDPE